MVEKTPKTQKYFDDQLDDEDVLLVFRKHPVVMRKGLVLAMFGPLLGIIPVFVRPTLGFGWFFGGLAAGFVACFVTGAATGLVTAFTAGLAAG